jgi:hypothetical protein
MRVTVKGGSNCIGFSCQESSSGIFFIGKGKDARPDTPELPQYSIDIVNIPAEKEVQIIEVVEGLPVISINQEKGSKFRLGKPRSDWFGSFYVIVQMGENTILCPENFKGIKNLPEEWIDTFLNS